MRASIRLTNELSADRDPAWRTWLTAIVAAWIVFSHIVGVVSGDPQSLVAESSQWGVTAEWIEHWLVLGVGLLLLAATTEALVHRRRRQD